jgi:hypothetical protein
MASYLDPAEYHVVRGLRRLAGGLRRLGARVFLAPLHAELRALRERQDVLERQLHALRGRAFDQDALARRLADLEDAVIELREVLFPPAEEPLPGAGRLPWKG